MTFLSDENNVNYHFHCYSVWIPLLFQTNNSRFNFTGLMFYSVFACGFNLQNTIKHLITDVQVVKYNNVIITLKGKRIFCI